MSAGLVRQWIRSGALDLPLPGGGATATRWNRLAELAETDVTAGRLAEAHLDAVAILAELGGPPRSLSFGQPSLGDVFLKITGHAIRDAS